MSSQSDITKVLAAHYEETFARHGPTTKGVDWGSSPEKHRLRLENMLAVFLKTSESYTPSLLDVGCGYGSLLQLLRAKALPVRYSGIDVCEAMVQHATKQYADAKWITGDFLALETDESFDYVVCNGILTQKLGASVSAMDAYMKQLITKMFSKCNIGIAFNVMTTRVNFMASNLYYKDPLELLEWCMKEFTPKVRLDHAYPLFEYTIYLYREDAFLKAFGDH